MNVPSKNSKLDAAPHPLAAFAASLRWEDIPTAVQDRTIDLLVDWFGSVLAGHTARSVASIARFALAQGPAEGSCELIGHDRGSSPMMAAMANAAASHVVEQDDVHNGSVFHPAAVVFAPALAASQWKRADGELFLSACVAGYEVGVRVGEFLGQSHYRIFHTTATAGTFAAAAAVGRVLGLSPAQMQHAFGSAGTQSAGLWEFLRTGADSKQLHTAHASMAGLASAFLAADGFTGAQDIFTGAQGLAAGTSSDADASKLHDRLGSRWAVTETSFKWHASCRHTHPAADALLQVMQDHKLRAADIEQVNVHVHQAALDVLGPVVDPANVHQSKFSMGTVLALIARFGRAGLREFDEYWSDPETITFRERAVMILDPEIEKAYPQRWLGKVDVRTFDGRSFWGRVDEPKGDPGNTLSRSELVAKAQRLASYGGIEPARAADAVARLWNIPNWKQVQRLLTPASCSPQKI